MASNASSIATVKPKKQILSRKLSVEEYMDVDMRRILLGVFVLFIGVAWTAAPIPGLLGDLGSLPFLVGMVLVVSRVAKLTFGERMTTMRYAFWATLAGILPYGMAKYPKVELAAQIGNAIDHPMLMAIYMAVGFTAMFMGGIALLANLLASGDILFGSGGEKPPGPEDL